MNPPMTRMIQPTTMWSSIRRAYHNTRYWKIRRWCQLSRPSGCSRCTISEIERSRVCWHVFPKNVLFHLSAFGCSSVASLISMPYAGEGCSMGRNHMSEPMSVPEDARTVSCDGDRPLRTTHNVPIYCGESHYQHAQYLATHGWDRTASLRRERELMARIYAVANLTR